MHCLVVAKWHMLSEAASDASDASSTGRAVGRFSRQTSSPARRPPLSSRTRVGSRDTAARPCCSPDCLDLGRATATEQHQPV